MAGVDVKEARISHLAYAPEIAGAMLQRQQASAIVAARQKIVEGAVGMVELALQQLEEHGTVKLDDERKAQMVSNLLVVLVRGASGAAGGQHGDDLSVVGSKRAEELSIRIDAEVLDAVRRWADDDLRSLNGHIEYLIKGSFAPRGSSNPRG